MKNFIYIALAGLMTYGCTAPPQQMGRAEQQTEQEENTGGILHEDLDPVRTHASVSPRTESNEPQGSQGPTGTNPEEQNFEETNTYGRRYYEDTYGSPYDPHTRPGLYELGGANKFGNSGSTNAIQQQSRPEEDDQENN